MKMFFYSFTKYSSFIIVDIELLRFSLEYRTYLSRALKTNKREKNQQKRVYEKANKKKFNKERLSFIYICKRISSLLNLNHLLYVGRECLTVKS